MGVAGTRPTRLTMGLKDGSPYPAGCSPTALGPPPTAEEQGPDLSSGESRGGDRRAGHQGGKRAARTQVA